MNESLTFDGANTQRCVNVSALDDELLEGEENLFLDLDTEEPTVVLDPEEAEVRINDTDRKLFGFLASFIMLFLN